MHPLVLWWSLCCSARHKLLLDAAIYHLKPTVTQDQIVHSDSVLSCPESPQPCMMISAVDAIVALPTTTASPVLHIAHLTARNQSTNFARFSENVMSPDL